MDTIKKFYYDNDILIRRTLIVLGLTAGVYLFVNVIFSYISPFLIGFIISLIADRPVGYFSRKLKIGRGILGFLFIVLILGLIVLLGTWLGGILINQAQQFIGSLDQYTARLQELYTSLQSQYNNVMNVFPENLQENLPAITNSIKEWATALLSTGMGKTGAGIMSVVPNLMLNVILIVLSSFFFIKDKELIKNSLRNILPTGAKRAADVVIAGMFKALLGYVRAQLIIMSATASVCILGLTILKMPFSMFQGLLIAFVDALPVFGSGAVFWPWALISVLAGEYRFAIGLMIVYGCVFLTRQLLEPKVLSSQIGVHPLLTLISIFIGLKVFGFLGFLFGPMIVITSKLIFTISTPKPAELTD